MMHFYFWLYCLFKTLSIHMTERENRASWSRKQRERERAILSLANDLRWWASGQRHTIETLSLKHSSYMHILNTHQQTEAVRDTILKWESTVTDPSPVTADHETSNINKNTYDQFVCACAFTRIQELNPSLEMMHFTWRVQVLVFHLRKSSVLTNIRSVQYVLIQITLCWWKVTCDWREKYLQFFIILERERHKPFSSFLK